MYHLWHRVSTTLTFDLNAIKSPPSDDLHLYTYKRPNAIPCSMILTPACDLLFVPLGAVEKKARIKGTQIVFDALKAMDSTPSLFLEALQQSTKKGSTAYDYNNMFPLLIKGDLIFSFKSVCLVEAQKYHNTIDEAETKAKVDGKTENKADAKSEARNTAIAGLYSLNSLEVIFKTASDCKKLRQVGIIFDDTLLHSSIIKEALYFNNLADSLNVNERFSSATDSLVCSLGLRNGFSHNSPIASPYTYMPSYTLSQGVELCYSVVKNVHKRVTLFFSLGTVLLKRWMEQYMHIRPMHLSMKSNIHVTLLHNVGKVILNKSLTLNYLRLLDYHNAPGLIVKNRGLFEILRRQILDSCENPTTVNPFFWKRIGFQGASPLTDFRASSLLALVALHIFADQYPDILLNGSYGDYDDELDTVNHLLFLCADKFHEQIRATAQALPDGDEAVAALALLLSDSTVAKAYAYPISLSIFSMTHYIFTRPDVSQELAITPFLALLISDFSVQYTDFVNVQIMATASGAEYSPCGFEYEHFVTVKELETVPVTEKVQASALTYKGLIVDLFEKKVHNFAVEALKVVDPMIDTQTSLPNPKHKYGPWKEFHDHFWNYFSTSEHFMMPLVTGTPAPIFDGLFRLIIGLAIILHKRIQRLPPEARYMQYNAVYSQLIKDLEATLAQTVNVPIYTIEDLLVYLSKHGST